MAEICSPEALARSRLWGSGLSSLLPAKKALIVQCFATLVVFFIATVLLPLQSVGLFYWALLQGVVAALTGRYFRMAHWWTAIHLVFFPALVLALMLAIPPSWFLAMFLVLALMYGKTYQTQVPLYLSGRRAISALSSVLPEKQGFRFMDLGSGCGGLLFYLARTRPDGKYCGVETAPLPFLLSLCRKVINACDCRIYWENLWDHDLSSYDVVYAYLSPVPMERLWHKARREMKPGSVFVSNSFVVPDVDCDRIIHSPDHESSPLYIWYM